MSKSGKQTHGLDRFFSSLYGKPIAGLSFFALSLISISAAEKAAAKARAQAKKAKPKQKKKSAHGRPKSRQNRDKTKVSLTPELKQIQAMLTRSDS